MTYFVIEQNKRFLSLPVTLCGYNFPLGWTDLESSTHFPFKLAAERMIKKYKLINCTVEEFDFETNKRVTKNPRRN